MAVLFDIEIQLQGGKPIISLINLIITSRCIVETELYQHKLGGMRCPAAVCP